MSDAILAVDVGGTSAKAEVWRADGSLAMRMSTPLAHLRGSALMAGRVVEACAEFADQARSNCTLQAIGVVVPGIVDEERAVGVSSMLLGWADVPFGSLISRACGSPTALGHDVRTAAAAEFAAADEPLRDALFVSIGTGVGAGVLVNGAMYTGGHRLGGEIAHVVVDPAGPPCPCGKRGCVEVIAAAPAISAAHAEAVGPGSARTGVGSIAGDPADAARVAALAASGDPVASWVWQRATQALGAAIATYCEILDPVAVILGGGVSAAGEQLRAPVEQAVLAGLGLPVRPAVQLARLGPRAGVVGAAALAWELVGR